MNIDIQAGPVRANKPADAIVLGVGDDYRAIVDASPEGATFWFETGIHRFEDVIAPKDGQTFLGAQGAILDGAAEIDTFSRDGDAFVIEGQTQQGRRLATSEGAEGAERAGFPETVFFDGEPLTPVASRGALEAGSFYFDYAEDEIVLADDPSGRLVEVGVTSAAFSSNAEGVTVSNLTIRHFNSPTQTGAIQGGEDWTVTNNEVHSNYGVGITVQSGGVIAGNDVHDNGQLGIGASGADIRVEGNEIHSNGFWSGIDVFWEGGGTKFGAVSDLVVRGNYSHDNHGFGLWTDESGIRVLYEDNVLVRNDGGGISHEISYTATIRDNVFIGNGTDPQGGWLWGGAIQIQNSSDVEVTGNRIDASGGLNGIALIQQDRGDGAFGPHDTTGNTIYGNVIVSKSGITLNGGVADSDENVLLNGDNAFYDNDYYMEDGDFWRWGDFPSGDDWEAYLADSGQGDGSRLLSPDAIDTSGWLTASSGTSSPSPTFEVTDAPDVVTTDPTDTVETVGLYRGTDDADDFEAGSGNDTLDGRGGRDVLEGGAGDDVLIGGGGSDVFLFEINADRDVIKDFATDGPDEDVVILPDDYFENAAAVLDALQDVDGDVVIAYGDNVLTIENARASEFTEDHFLLY